MRKLGNSLRVLSTSEQREIFGGEDARDLRHEGVDCYSRLVYGGSGWVVEKICY